MTGRRPISPLPAARLGHGPRLVLVHGFTQTREAWRTLAERLAEAGHEIVLVDLPGHGAAGDLDLDLWDTAGALAAAGGRAVYVGYSLGGRVCLHLAVRHPELVEALVLIGATPGIVDDRERATRRSADDRLAEHIGAVGVEQFLDEWLAQPLFATLSPSDADLAARRSNTAAGLATSLRRAGTGVQQPLWDRLAGVVAPVLTVVGAADTKFAEIADRMRQHLARAEGIVLPGCGHAAHLERPDAFVEATTAWLERLSAGERSADRHPDRGE